MDVCLFLHAGSRKDMDPDCLTFCRALGILSLVDTYCKHLGWLLLADVIEWMLPISIDLCEGNPLFLLNYGFWGTISHTAAGEIHWLLRQVVTRLNRNALVFSFSIDKDHEVKLDSPPYSMFFWPPRQRLSALLFVLDSNIFTADCFSITHWHLVLYWTICN